MTAFSHSTALLQVREAVRLNVKCQTPAAEHLLLLRNHVLSDSVHPLLYQTCSEIERLSQNTNLKCDKHSGGTDTAVNVIIISRHIIIFEGTQP